MRPCLIFPRLEMATTAEETTIRLLTILLTDSRFPFDKNDSGSVQLASPDHNIFFLDHLKGWLNSTEESFSEYMQNANRYGQTSDFLRRLDPN